MDNNAKLALLRNRLQVMMGRGDKNIKSGGVARKLRRQIRNLEKEV